MLIGKTNIWMTELRASIWLPSSDRPPLTIYFESIQPGQAQVAADHGMTVAEMNRTHDLTHVLLSHWLGLPVSPTLDAVAAGGEPYPHWRAEEAAVLAIQAFAKAAGVDLVKLAREQDK